jgi:hypothetical protein
MPTAKVSEAQNDHIKAVGRVKFELALANATMAVRSDNRLVGLDKIRVPLAFQAALEATGYPKQPFMLGRQEMSAELQAICNSILDKARAAAAP